MFTLYSYVMSQAYTIEKIVGIDCIFAPMPESNSITIEVMAKAGSVYETRETNWLSHFLEHMFFKGGKKYATPKAVSEALDSFGAEYNAYTGEEYAGYYVKSGPAFLHKAIDVLADMLTAAQFPKDEMEREKGVIIQEIKMYEDLPPNLALDRWKRYYYGDNSYGWSTLGPVENITAFTQDHFFSHKEQLYTKDNIVIIVAGKILDPEAIKAQIAELFDILPSKRNYRKPFYPHHRPETRREHYDKWTQQNHLVISADGFSLQEEQRYPAEVLATMLGGNMSSRLFQNIREKEGLCYYIKGAHYSSPEEGVFVVRAGIEKDRFDYGLEKIYAELADIAAGNFDEQEFSKAMNGTIWGLQISVETSNEMSSFLGMQYLLSGKIETLTEQISSYKSLTQDDIRQVAKKLQEDELYLYYIS
jgi:predicted Zn-dependent peptidase